MYFKSGCTELYAGYLNCLNSNLADSRHPVRIVGQTSLSGYCLKQGSFAGEGVRRRGTAAYAVEEIRCSKLLFIPAQCFI